MSELQEEIDQLIEKMAKLRQRQVKHDGYLVRLAVFILEKHNRYPTSIYRLVAWINAHWQDEPASGDELGEYVYGLQEKNIAYLEEVLNAVGLHLSYYEEDGQMKGVRIKEVQ